MSDTHPSATAANTAPKPPKLLDLVREKIRAKHYSRRTEESYTQWVKRFVLFHNKRHPRDMGAPEVEAFLNHLANARNVSASTHQQALSALIFLYKDTLGIELPWLNNLDRPQKTQRLPTVLTHEEALRLISHLQGTHRLVARLLYGTGMRLMECLALRIKDVDFQMRQITIRDGKGGKDWVTMLPAQLADPLRAHLERVRVLHAADLAEGCGAVWLPDAPSAKYPNAAREWGWQYVFPARGLSVDPRSGQRHRHRIQRRSPQASNLLDRQPVPIAQPRLRRPAPRRHQPPDHRIIPLPGPAQTGAGADTEVAPLVGGGGVEQQRPLVVEQPA